MKTLTIIMLVLIGVTLQAQESPPEYRTLEYDEDYTWIYSSGDSATAIFSDTMRSITLPKTWHLPYRLIPNPSWDDSSIGGELLSDYIRKIIREEETDAYPNDLIHVVGAKEGALLIILVGDVQTRYIIKQGVPVKLEQ